MPLVWLDLETTGLDPDAGLILEVAVVVTDEDLVPFYSRSLLVDGRPLGDLGDDDHEVVPWSQLCDADVMRMHTDNGLFRAIDEARPGSAEMAAEVLLADLVPLLGKLDDFGPLCGNGVAHFDRPWLARHMPALEQRFSYRNLDTRSLWLAVQRWADFGGAPTDARTHRAMPDVLDAINFARWFRGRFMPPAGASAN